MNNSFDHSRRALQDPEDDATLLRSVLERLRAGLLIGNSDPHKTLSKANKVLEAAAIERRLTLELYDCAEQISELYLVGDDTGQVEREACGPDNVDQIISEWLESTLDDAERAEDYLFALEGCGLTIDREAARDLMPCWVLLEEVIIESTDGDVLTQWNPLGYYTSPAAAYYAGVGEWEQP